MPCFKGYQLIEKGCKGFAMDMMDVREVGESAKCNCLEYIQGNIQQSRTFLQKLK